MGSYRFFVIVDVVEKRASTGLESNGLGSTVDFFLGHAPFNLQSDPICGKFRQILGIY